MIQKIKPNPTCVYMTETSCMFLQFRNWSLFQYNSNGRYWVLYLTSCSWFCMIEKNYHRNLLILPSFVIATFLKPMGLSLQAAFLFNWNPCILFWKLIAIMWAFFFSVSFTWLIFIYFPYQLQRWDLLLLLLSCS